MISWHVGISGEYGCLRHHAAFLLQSRRSCRSPRLCKSGKLRLQAAQPAENVRVSLAIPSVSVIPTRPDNVEATVKQRSPVNGGSSSEKVDETTDVQKSEGLQSGTIASKPAPNWPRPALESRDNTRDRRQTLPSNKKMVTGSSQRNIGIEEERSGSGRKASTSELEIKAEGRDDLGGNVSTDEGRTAGDTNRGLVTGPSSGSKAKYAEEKVRLTSLHRQHKA